MEIIIMTKKLCYLLLSFTVITSSSITQAQAKEYLIRNELDCDVGVQTQNRGRVNLLHGQSLKNLDENSFPIEVFSSCPKYAGSLKIEKPTSEITCQVIEPGAPGPEAGPGNPPSLDKDGHWIPGRPPTPGGSQGMVVRPEPFCPS